MKGNAANTAPNRRDRRLRHGGPQIGLLGDRMVCGFALACLGWLACDPWACRHHDDRGRSGALVESLTDRPCC